MISEGDIFRTSAGATYRLLKITNRRGRAEAHVFSMENPKALPQAWPYEEFKQATRDKEYTRIVGRSPTVLHLMRSASLADRTASEKLKDWRWALIRHLANDERVLYRQYRGQLVEDWALLAGVSEQTILTCLRLYWSGGMTRDALLGKYFLSGKPKNLSAVQAPRGRKPRNERYVAYVYKDESEKRRIVNTALRYMRKKRTNTRRFVYRRVVAAHYSVLNEEGKKVQRPLGERPKGSCRHQTTQASDSQEGVRNPHSNLGDRQRGAHGLADTI